MADGIANGGGKKEKKRKSSRNKSSKDSAKESTACVEVDTNHQKKRKKVREVEVIHGNGKETNKSIDVMQVDSTKRGKKRKNSSVSPEENQENHLVIDEALPESKAKKKKEAKKSCDKFEDSTQMVDTNDYVEPKRKKHKKHVADSEVLDGNVNSVQSGYAIDKEPKSKDKKKKKRHSSSECLNTESIENGSSIPCDAKKENDVHENKETLVSHIENDMEPTSKDKKKKKKKKKKKHKSMPEHLNTTEIIENDGNLSCDVKKENGSTNKNTPNEKNEMTPNEKNGTNTNCLSQLRTEKKQYSHENKSIPFQRVKIDEVKFADERLQDNSYWAKGGADSGYGAKAQEVLGQVRGRDFRHEKTKKKRGSYRGGIIDLESHSIKFNYSDED